MNTFLCLLMSVTASVEVALAPDQPLAYVYADEPLILELRSTEDGEATVNLSVTSEQLQEAVSIDLPPLSLRSKSSRWYPVRNMPTARGLYRVKTTITLNGQASEHENSFYRVDRPPAEPRLPAYAHGVPNNPHAMLALSTAGVNVIRLNAAQQDIRERLKLAAQQNFRAVVFLDPTQLSEPAALVAELSKEYCADIVRWEIEPHGDPALLGAMADTVRQAGCNASIAVVIPNVQTLAELLQYKTGHQVREAVLLSDAPTREDVDAVRDLTEQAGYEAWRVHVLGRGVRQEGKDQGRALVQQLINNLAYGVSTTGFDSALVYHDRLYSALSYLGGASHRLTGSQYAGAFPAGAGVTAHVLRADGQWLLVLWSDTARSTRITVGNAEDVTATTAINNPLELKKNMRGEISLSLGPDPVYISGRGGTVLGEAAANQVRQFSEEFVSQFRNTLPPELIAAVSGFAQNPRGSANRVGYFTILRALPDLEQRWHGGQLPRAVAVPAIAQLARVARSLATVEQARGEAFVEPLQETLARGEEFQSLYLTGSTGSSEANERGDWLVDEVRRLLDEAENLSKSGRDIEASAVAALAEWRSRGLDFAANAKPASEDAEPVQVAMLPLPNATPPPPEPEAVSPVEVTPPPPEPAPALPPPPVETKHVVAKGENASIIASKLGVKLDDLLAWNNLTKRSMLRIGQELTIKKADGQPSAGAPAAPEPSSEPQPEPQPEPPAPAPAGVSGPATHTIVAGDTPGGIAQKYGIKLADLLAWNKMSRNSTLRIGKELVVRDPASASGEQAAPEKEAPAPAAPEETAPEQAQAAPPAEEPAPEAPQPQQAEDERRTHKVARGENPSIIAQKYGISLDEFLRLNGFNRNVRFQVGDEVIVGGRPADQGAAPAPEPSREQPRAEESRSSGPRTIIHTVKKGDTPRSIAAQYGVDYESFRKHNGLRQNATLRVGRKYEVVIPAGKTVRGTASAAAGAGKVHKVARGDSPYTISKKYNVDLDDLLKWNNLNRSSTLHIGQEIIVSPR